MPDSQHEHVVPLEANKRGQLVVGDLKAESASIPSILVQFSKVSSMSRRASIYLYPTLDQAKRLFAIRSPFSFEGTSYITNERYEIWTAEGIWLKSGSEIGSKSGRYWTAPWGSIESLRLKTVSSDDMFKSPTASAWFIADCCFLFQLLATSTEDEIQDARRFGFRREKFVLNVSDGGIAEIERQLHFEQVSSLKEIRKRRYSIHVRNYADSEVVKKDVEALVILGSLASREQAAFWHYAFQPGTSELTQYWRLNLGKRPKRNSHTDPLLPREIGTCIRFLETAFPRFRSAEYSELFRGAVYALMARELALELRIARLFSGIQGALVFALQEPRRSKRPTLRSLYQKFVNRYGDHFQDLWPLLRSTQDCPSLYELRSAVVHGDTFTEEDFLALSYASQQLEWVLERILLLSVGWKVEESSVSPQALERFCAYHWREVQQRLRPVTRKLREESV